MTTNKKPYSFQEDGIRQMLSMKRVINGDACGLGKTMQSIIAVERAKATPCLIVCPSALKINWERETRMWTDLRPLVLTESVKSTFPYFIGQMNLYDVIITNYESLKKYFVVKAERGAKLRDIVFQDVIKQFKSVILDEAHRCKNPSTATARYVMGICQGKEHIFELTGTPIINDPKDIAAQIAILGRMHEFGGYSEFINTYGDGSNLQELNEAIHKSCYFRREKSDVLKDLPDLTRSKIVTDLSDDVQSEYDLCMNDLRSWLSEYKKLSEPEVRKKMRVQALVKFMNLRTLAGKGKLQATIQFLNDNPDPIVVFAEHHEIVDAIKEAFPDAVCVTGRQNAQAKQAAIDSFQSGKRRIIICSIRSAGVGITLTASSNELFVEQPWTYSDLTQCEARCWRNGQKNAVNSWILIGNNTIDEYLFKLIMDKKSVASRITGERDEAIRDDKYFDELVDAILSDRK